MIGAEELSTDDGENAGWSVINRAVSSWRRMTVLLRTDRAEGGLVNGTTRLQPDLAQSSGLGASFDMLFSSELLCGHKPSPEACEKTPMFVRAQPEHSRCPCVRAIYGPRRPWACTLCVSIEWTDVSTRPRTWISSGARANTSSIEMACAA